ncbi:MAG: hypothetical protein NC821_04300, partial [Candidatus Omnitrophica bacterium]|nr:hypothetical protein [Candidatus Omnitrophota bacterium]
MFDLLKIFKGQEFSQEEFIRRVNNLGYHRREEIDEEGDFCSRGEVMEIFPVTFESPVKIVWDDQRIESLSGFNLATGEVISDFEILIILPLAEKTHRIKT